MLLAAAHSAEPLTVTVGATSTTSDAPIYIADKLGYFSDEGLSVTVSNFRSASDMVAPLGTGELDAGAGSPSAGLYNAVLRGVRIKIVADKASSPPGYGATKILVRKDLVDNGRYRQLSDLKGMKFAMNAPGVSNTATLNALLKMAGLQYSDVDTVNLPFPDHVAALKNKSVDASASVEPGPAIAIKNGFAELIESDDQIIPNHQIAVLLYSEKFAQHPDISRRFMRAYLRAVRDVQRSRGRWTPELVTCLAKWTSLPESTIRQIPGPAYPGDGSINNASVAHQEDFWHDRGLVTTIVPPGAFIDSASLSEAMTRGRGGSSP